MSAGGGPFVKLTIAGRPFKYTADATPSVKRGGFENAYEPNGDGTARQLKTRVTWAITGNKVEIDNSNDDFEFLNDTKDSATDYDIQVEYADGTVRIGTGNIVGELPEDNTSASATFDVGGPGELKKL